VNFDLVNYILRQRGWSGRTFGDGRRTGGITKHIEKELNEIRAAPGDLEEWMDVIILGLDGAWRTGATPEQICEALQAKQDKNLARKFNPPISEDEPSEHIRDESWMPDGAHNH
jgi:hypothetical protein